LDGILPYSDLLCRIRLALTCLLLLGVLPRLNALLLALVSFSIFAADGFRYLHHLLILSVSVLFLALPHVRGASSDQGEASDSTGSLALLTLRAHVMVAYFFAGLAKCMDSWLSGATLRALHEPAFATGPVMDASVRAVGYAGLSWGACLAELGAPFLLAFRKTRLLGVLSALSLHAFVHATILVSTFGITMAVLLGAFLPTAEERQGPVVVPNKKWILAFTLAAALPISARVFSTGVGSYSMFTRLVHYTLEMRVDETPFRRAQLAEHMGRDGAHIVRLANGRGIGETNVEILRRSLPRLSTFLCTLSPGAQRTSVSLKTERIEGGSVTEVSASRECATAR
jgi:hypothetical protein